MTKNNDDNDVCAEVEIKIMIDNKPYMVWHKMMCGLRSENE